MSKITPKNLHYDSTLPPFLARLQANHAAQDDRHDFDIARPKKQRDAAADAEDEPVYFDEATGDSLTKGEWEERQREKENSPGEGKEEEKPDTKGERTTKENIAVIGGVRKRKMGKVIGGEESAGEESRDAARSTSKPEGKKQEKGKTAKKGKKIKLSFGDDE
jgi:hypothetical protein